MGIFGLNSILGAAVGAAVAGGVVYSSMLLREKIVVDGAVMAERNVQTSLCNDRVLAISATVNAAVRDGVQKALDAAAREAPTPEEEAQIFALCKRSASCRSKGEMP